MNSFETARNVIWLFHFIPFFPSFFYYGFPEGDDDMQKHQMLKQSGKIVFNNWYYDCDPMVKIISAWDYVFVSAVMDSIIITFIICTL